MGRQKGLKPWPHGDSLLSYVGNKTWVSRTWVYFSEFIISVPPYLQKKLKLHIHFLRVKQRGVWTRPLRYFFLLVRFPFSSCLPNGIGEVKATMLNCNKISPAFSYLSSVQLGIIEGKVRVGVPISAGSLWILAIGVSRVPWCCLRTTHQGGIFHDLHAIFMTR
jgi:hypothetical protein